MAKESETSSRLKTTQKMETNIQIFTSENFGEIRTCQVNNQIMFVGKDVATALGYSNSQKAIRDHVDDDDKLTERFVLSGHRRDLRHCPLSTKICCALQCCSSKIDKTLKTCIVSK